MTEKLSILVLAAGNSSRLGRPKQLVEFQGQTLIERIIETAVSVSEDVLIVLGGNAEQILPKLLKYEKKISSVINPNWQQGMGTSISFGVELIKEKSELILILLADQPFVSKVLLQKMVQSFAISRNPIVCCVYNKTLGVPILFEKSMFSELLNLKGNQGAKSFLHLYEDKISTIDFQEGLIDIDTIEDVEKLQKHLH